MFAGNAKTKGFIHLVTGLSAASAYFSTLLHHLIIFETLTILGATLTDVGAGLADFGTVQ